MWQSKVVIKCSGHIFSDRNGRLDVLSPLKGASLPRPVSVYGDGYKEYYEILCASTILRGDNISGDAAKFSSCEDKFL